MAEYNHRQVEQRWQQEWEKRGVYRVKEDPEKPKYYVLDMFPYPSGAGLHVGHPLGYIATDIISRFKRLKGYNVLHPMGFDSFGLPAEQYAIQTGQHPAITTEANIKRYKEQLRGLGFSYDWSREVRTSDPTYYKWTQWIFKQLFNSWYNRDTDKAERVPTLIKKFEQEGNHLVNAACNEDTPSFSAAEWNAWPEAQQQQMLLNYRLAYLGETTVNWCPALGTVLANDEVKDGFSERGGHPVEKKNMLQWSMRITAYADRLLEGLERIDWPEPIKEMQRNWIGKSFGAEVEFVLSPNESGHSPKKSDLPGWETANPKLAKVLTTYARENRKAPTKQEDALWQSLRNKQIGYKVRRQHPIEDFIVDFVFLNQKLVVEVDGPYHDTEEQKEFDRARKEFLESLGYEVFVVKNEEVDSSLNSVVHTIKHKLNEIEERTPSPVEKVPGDEVKKIRVFTTRIDTIYGVTFMVLAPEHELVPGLTVPDRKAEVEKYVAAAKNRSERERMSDVKAISGVFTGSYVIHPFSGEKIPIWIADYVLAGYGTGAVMAVPSGDQRDFDFAKHFDLPIVQIIDSQKITDTEADPTKEGKMVNSGFLDGLSPVQAIERANEEIVKRGIGTPKVNYRMRDAAFGRQRYWGEPIPVYFRNGIPCLVEEDKPLELPEVDTFLPTEDGEPPLGRAENWKTADGHPYELTTMPGWAGSSWYFFRYMDPHNDREFASKEALSYWQDVDFYMGGSEHATGHLLYSRFWTKFLYDLGHVQVDEYAKKLVNQGMIQGRSNFAYRLLPHVITMSWGKGEEIDPNTIPKIYVSKEFYDAYQKDLFKTTPSLHSNLSKRLYEIRDKVKETTGSTIGKIDFSHIGGAIQPVCVDVNIVKDDILDIEAFKKSRPEDISAEFVLEGDKYICGWEVEKMSKSKFNVVNPDELVEKYGADTLRMYEMFLGPIEQSKPWNTNGIEGVYKFLRKFWGLFHDKQDNFSVSDTEPSKEELKVLHGLLKKIEEDVERLSLNTSVSSFMIATNELGTLKCNKRAILEPMTIALAPYAPHIAEELWSLLGHEGTIFNASFPAFDEQYLREDSFEYPIMVNGKMRARIEFAVDAPHAEMEKEVLAHPSVAKWLGGKSPKKVIIVPKKIVNVVV